MSSREIRVGLIGCGGIARGYHLGSYRRSGKASVVAACDISEAARQSMRDDFSIARTYADLHEMLEHEDLDLVSICTTNDMHYAATMAAISRGIDVFCEKPLAMTVQQAREMLAAAREKGISSGVNFAHRRTPAAMLAREIIASGLLGPVHYVSAVYAAGGVGYASRPGTWRNQRELAGYGALGDMGSHMLDMVMWWLDARATDVACATQIVVPERLSRVTGQPMRVTTDDHGMLLLRLSNGALGYLCGSYMFTGRGYDQRIEVYGSEGGLIYNQQRPYKLQVRLPDDALVQYTVLRKGGTPDTPYTTILVPERLHDRIPGADGRRTVLMDFVDTYRGARSEPFSPGFLEGVLVQEILEASAGAERSRTWVSLE